MDKLYAFEKLPENIRQVGEQPKHGRVYFEDYVVTYMKEVFKKRPEKSIVVYLGKPGSGESAGYQFIYGAVEMAFGFADGKDAFSADKWDSLYEIIQDYFPGSQILGWGAGVCMMNSALQRRIEDIQKKHFGKRNQICFIWDESEESQTLYRFADPQLKKMSGYTIYYGKNPQMQEYVLRGRKKESMEASYVDPVMSTVRETIKKNEERRQGRKTIAVAAVLFFVLTGAGGIFLMQSNRKIEKLEQTLAVVSGNHSKSTTVEEDSGEEENTTDAPQESQNPSGSPEGLETPRESELPEEPENSLETPLPKETSNPQKPSASGKQEAPVEKAKQESVKNSGSESSSQTAAKKTASPEKKQPPAKKASAPTYQSYLVQKGDTLSQIVWRQYHDLSKLPLIKKRNHITDENKIREGQRIILPIY